MPTGKRQIVALHVAGDMHRVAHLVCEFFARMTAAGLCEGETCDFPWTQTELGDVLGLSTVHLNRTIKQLHRDDLITVHSNLLTVNDWTGLKDAVDFNSAYLELVGPAVLRKQ